MDKDFQKTLNTLFEEVEQAGIRSGNPSVSHFAKRFRWETSFFVRIWEVGKQRGVTGIEELFRSEKFPPDSLIGGEKEDAWYPYFWYCLFPERFTINTNHAESLSTGKLMILKPGEPFGERERTIILGLLTSPVGLSLILKAVMDAFRGRMGNQITWGNEAPEFFKKLGTLFETLSVCPKCGTFFLREVPWQKYCSDRCRKQVNAVPSQKRKDQTARTFFCRKVTRGISREDAWNQTKKQHGEALQKLGLDGPKPPTSWAKTKKGE